VRPSIKVQSTVAQAYWPRYDRDRRRRHGNAKIARAPVAGGRLHDAFASAEVFLERAIVDQAIGPVVDIHLGCISGIELRPRLLAARSPLPVVFSTAREDEATRREAFAAGSVDYLQKPFNANRLLEALARGRKP
jgi:FixJ family two-component response regulator